jgi:hypothetical protein
MGLFKRRTAGDAAVADPPARTEDLLDEIARRTAANRAQRDPEHERRLLQLRHQAGVRRLAEAGPATLAAADEAALPPGRLPEIPAAELTPGLLRAGILRDGCVLVRGLIERDAALALADGIDRAFADRVAAEAEGVAARGLYEEFDPETYFEIASVRPWIRDGGGVLATDSPALTFQFLEVLGAAGVTDLVGRYLGEPPLLSVHKTTLRKADPSVGGAWHQDGAFMGEVRALNLWLSLSRCGDVAPGLDLVPRRVDHVVIDHDVMLDVELTRAKAAEAAGDVEIVRPIFEPGDALFFDELFLHQTASDPAMPNPRFAVESWFFGGSAFPGDYAPVAV